MIRILTVIEGVPWFSVAPDRDPEIVAQVVALAERIGPWGPAGALDVFSAAKATIELEGGRTLSGPVFGRTVIFVAGGRRWGTVINLT